MGDCASRPTAREIEEHAYETNSTNDSYFSFVLTDDSKPNSAYLERKKQYYARRVLEFRKLLRIMPPGLPAIPELNVEIQKGLNFHLKSNCLNRGRPYVIVKLEPGGPSYETFRADSFKPYWYQIFQFKQNNVNYSHLEFSVMLERAIGGRVSLGSLRLKLSELHEQLLQEGWFPLENGPNAPALRLRVQFVFNQASLYASLITQCNERQNSLTDSEPTN